MGEEGYNLREVGFIDKATSRFEVTGVLLEHRITHFLFVAWGRFTPTLEDVSRLTLPPVFGEAAMRIVLEKEINKP